MGTVIQFDWGTCTMAFKDKAMGLSFEPPNPTFEQYEEAVKKVRELIDKNQFHVIGPAELIDKVTPLIHGMNND